MKKLLMTVSLIGSLMIFDACQKDQDNPVNTGWADYLLVVNEGPYQTGSGSITAYDRKTREVTQDVFNMVNGRPLGNIVQSMTVYGQYAYIAVNNANRVEVVDKVSFESAGAFTQVPFPAFFIGYDEEKGYLSCWDGTVKVLDLKGYTVTSSIVVGSGPERMLLAGDLWVLNSGGFGVDSTISIIEVSSDAIKKTLIAGHVPSGIVADHNGNIWVLCSGRGWNGFPAADDTPGRLLCYHPGTHQVLKEMVFPSSGLHPDNLVINPEGDILYYNHPQGIFAFPVSATELPDSPLLPRSTMLYGIGYDPVSDMILGADAVDYVQNGWAYFYDPSNGTKLDSFRTGIIPNGFWAGQ